MSIKPQASTALTMEQVLDLHVEAGKMTAFIVCGAKRQARLHLSRRAAVWFLQNLEELPQICEPGAVAQGEAERIEYQYGTHYCVLGTYPKWALRDFWRGVLGYYKRKMKGAERKRDRAKWLAKQAQKGGAAL